MVRDGVNYVPVLVEATVEVAMGQSGTTIAAETSDVVLIDDNLTNVISTIDHAKRGFSIAKQKIILALLTVSDLLIFVALGILNLVSGIIVNEGTAILIIANGLSMLKFRDQVIRQRGYSILT